MNMEHAASHTQMIYQTDPNMAFNLRAIRDHLHQLCNMHLNRPVQIQTLDGHVLQGEIVRVDNGLVYFRVSDTSEYRAFWGASQQILTLVLFELLTIALLS